MALNDNAVLTAATGYIFTAPEGTAPPTPQAVESFDPATGFPTWNNIGHTSRDDLPEFGYEGGDTETKGTWQSEALKTVVKEAAVDYVTWKLHQFDEEGLSLYYGQANGSTTTGEFKVTGTGAATRRALLIVIVDGPTAIAFYAPKVDIRRSDAIELAVDEFSKLPLRATFLKDTTKNELFRWISLDTGVNPADSPAGG